MGEVITSCSNQITMIWNDEKSNQSGTSRNGHSGHSQLKSAMAKHEERVTSPNWRALTVAGRNSPIGDVASRSAKEGLVRSSWKRLKGVFNWSEHNRNKMSENAVIAISDDSRDEEKRSRQERQLKKPKLEPQARAGEADGASRSESAQLAMAGAQEPSAGKLERFDAAVVKMAYEVGQISADRGNLLDPGFLRQLAAQAKQMQLEARYKQKYERLEIKNRQLEG